MTDKTRNQIADTIANIIDDSGNCTIADPCNPELPCCECQANAILAIPEIKGALELWGKRDGLVELTGPQDDAMSVERRARLWWVRPLAPAG